MRDLNERFKDGTSWAKSMDKQENKYEYVNLSLFS